MSFKDFTKELKGNRVEGELIKTMIYSILTSLIFLTAIYFILNKRVEDLVPKYGLQLMLLALSYSLVVSAIRQIRAYHSLNCMPGMMIGMTVGMLSGFLPGFFVASTNGLFVGSMFGVGMGIFLGIWAGKCCGIMGIMEGMMAGFMGGLMGAMTAFMLLNDQLVASSIIVFIISAIIMFSLNYMIYIETKEKDRELQEDQVNTIIITLILMAITSFLMIFGFRSAVFS